MSKPLDPAIGHHMSTGVHIMETAVDILSGLRGLILTKSTIDSERSRSPVPGQAVRRFRAQPSRLNGDP